MVAAPSSIARTSSPIDRRRQEPDRGEDAEAAADVVGDGEDVVVGVAIGLGTGRGACPWGR